MRLLEHFRICLELYCRQWLLPVILFAAVQGPPGGYVTLGTRVYAGKEPPTTKKQPLLNLKEMPSLFHELI